MMKAGMKCIHMIDMGLSVFFHHLNSRRRFVLINSIEVI